MLRHEIYESVLFINLRPSSFLRLSQYNWRKTALKSLLNGCSSIKSPVESIAAFELQVLQIRIGPLDFFL